MSVLSMMTRSTGATAVTDVFQGYSHLPRGGEGTFYDMSNMSGRDYPVIGTRPKRTIMATLTAPAGCAARDQMAVVDGANLKYGDAVIPLGLSTDPAQCPKQMISMGAYLLIWPDKKYFNTAAPTEYGDIENTVTVTAAVSVTMCRVDGSGYGAYTINDEPPESPANGDLWLDNSVEGVPVLKEWSETAAMWVTIPTTYLKFSAPGINSGFSAYDGVTLSDLTGDASAFNGSHVIYSVGSGYIVIPGIIDQASLTSGAVTVKRTVPDMDFITESGNRIWGCKYGIVDGKPVNEIYASKLGDFRNWSCYMGLSTDSWSASRGADGEFTGAATHQGHPIFFRENSFEKVFPAANGAHQIVTTEGRGVQKGCWRSLAIVGETLFYKSRDGVCAYNGALPTNVSQALGDVAYSDARAGAAGDKYYISMRYVDEHEVSRVGLFVFDTIRGAWYQEDNTEALCFTSWDGVAVWIDAQTKQLVLAREKHAYDDPDSWVQEEDFEWSLTSRALGYDFPENQYVSRFVIRAETEGNITMSIKYDNGPWLDRGTWYGASGVRSFVLPVPPRRCDYLRVRLDGTKPCRIYAIARHMRRGSDAMR